MKHCGVRMAAAVACLALSSHTVYAQRGTNDWMTAGYDAQRSHWVRNDVKISLSSMSKPGFALVWKVQIDKTPHQLNSLTTPALMDFYIGYRGFRTLGFFGGSSNTVMGIDTDLGRNEWEKTLGAPSTGGSSLSCPGGLTSAVTRPVSIGYPPLPTGRGFGRGNPAKSGVGEPNAGAVTIKPAGPAMAPPPAPVASSTARRVMAPPNPFAPRVQWLNVLTSDGKLHSFYVSNGEEPKPAISFLKPNANAQGLIVFDGFAYAATSSCSGVDAGVTGVSLDTQHISNWKAGSPTAGSANPAVSPDGTLYTSTEKEVVALEDKTLALKSSYKIDGTVSSSPVIFDYNGKDMLAVTSTDGKLHLIDTTAVNSKAISKSASFSSHNYATGAIASWQDPAGTRWLLVPAGGAAANDAGLRAASGNVTNGAIAAWKVEDENGAPVLKPGWVSRDLVSPITPIIVNGVVFALSSGEFRSADANMSAAQRAEKSTPAVLYALDALSGQELWNSGTTITSFVHSAGLAAGGSRVYVGTYDGTQYAFGFPIEH